MKVLFSLLMLQLSAFGLEEVHTQNDRIDSLHQVEMAEETYMAKSAFCCRISGNIVDVSGSIISYLTAALAGGSAITSFPSHVRVGLAVSAGVGGLIAGVLHNMKPVAEKIAKQKQERAEAIHKKHSEV